MSDPQKIGPFLWFNSQAEEAVNFYVAMFRNYGINTVTQAYERH